MKRHKLKKHKQTARKQTARRSLIIEIQEDMRQRLSLHLSFAAINYYLHGAGGNNLTPIEDIVEMGSWETEGRGRLANAIAVDMGLPRWPMHWDPDAWMRVLRYRLGHWGPDRGIEVPEEWRTWVEPNKWEWDHRSPRNPRKRRG